MIMFWRIKRDGARITEIDIYDESDNPYDTTEAETVVVVSADVLDIEIIKIK
jgi:hypothetical protein